MENIEHSVSPQFARFSIDFSKSTNISYSHGHLIATWPYGCIATWPCGYIAITPKVWPNVSIGHYFSSCTNCNNQIFVHIGVCIHLLLWPYQDKQSCVDRRGQILDMGKHKQAQGTKCWSRQLAWKGAHLFFLHLLIFVHCFSPTLAIPRTLIFGIPAFGYPWYPCDDCDKVYDYEGTLEKHIGAAHENVVLFCHFYNNNKECQWSVISVYLCM